MEDQEAVKIIQDRIGEMLSDPQIQDLLTKKRDSGLTKTECQDWLAMVAVTTLCGCKE